MRDHAGMGRTHGVDGFREVAEVVCDPARALVFEHGWQSWSPAGLYRATAVSPRPSDPLHQTMVYRPGRPAPQEGFQGEGLVAIKPEPGAEVMLWSAPRPERDVCSIRVHAAADRLIVSADGAVTEAVYAGPVHAALGAWADAVARRLGIGPGRPLPPVWCSWYGYWEAATEAELLTNLDAMDRFDLPVTVVQIDDGWQAGIGDWLEQSDRYRPLASLTGRIAASGRRSGLWLAPMVVGARSRLAAEHPEWLVPEVSAGHNWDQDLRVLDVTHPGAAAHLGEVIATLVGYGIRYLKLDFLYAGALPGRRHADAGPIDAYRHGLRLIRSAAGPDVTVLGCGAPLLPSLGLVDAMRVGPDAARPDDPGQTSLTRAMTVSRARAFQHSRWWVNDPDVLLVRPQIRDRERWAAFVEAVGGLVASGDPLDQLDSWGLATTRRLLRPSRTTPTDLALEPAGWP
jgi:alpha-galactosidase